jgi:pyruvate/2-oxoglutarate dehydrogenase complex dihydrolipoamide acyltransferase (E2) component
MDVIVTKEMLGDEAEADVSSWLVPNGALVSDGQPIAEIETGKVRVEITAPGTGTLEIIVKAGAVIEPDAVIARVV